MSVDLTKLSAAEYDNILYGNMTPAMAADYLRNGQIAMRSFAETLKELYPAPDLAPRLRDFFSKCAPDANPQSVSRKIYNWISGKHQPSSREDIFRIAFALALSEQQLNYLLSICTDYGIQYRNNREIILTWFLRSGYSYREALAFFAALPPVKPLERARGKHTFGLTHEIQADFQGIHTLEGLRDCYVKNLGRFGNMHLRAYYYFNAYLNQLIHPTPDWDSAAAEPDYSLEKVMETYLSFQLPPQEGQTNYSIVQRLLKQNWPNATSIKNIRCHKEDVPRKLLLLLYVVTENETADVGPYRELDEDYSRLEDRLEDHWWTLNAILEDCGMAALDPRNVTDWLILYSISAGPEEPMSERLEQVLSHVFDCEGESEGE